MRTISVLATCPMVPADRHRQVRGTLRTTGRSAAWLARLLWEQEVASSNLAVPTRRIGQDSSGAAAPAVGDLTVQHPAPEDVGRVAPDEPERHVEPRFPGIADPQHLGGHPDRLVAAHH